jgi:hypothetical protein
MRYLNRRWTQNFSSNSRQWKGGGEYAVSHLFETMCYKLKDREFDSPWGVWTSSLTDSVRRHCSRKVDPACNRNGYHRSSLGGKGDRCLRLSTFPLSRADCLEILAASNSRSSRDRTRKQTPFVSWSELSKDEFNHRHLPNTEVECVCLYLSSMNISQERKEKKITSSY